MNNVTKTFLVQWKIRKSKESFLRSAAGKRWLEKKLVLPAVVPAQLVAEVDTNGPDPEMEARKPFEGKNGSNPRMNQSQNEKSMLKILGWIWG